ncbi:MAG: arsenate reductase ArsC [Halioglobus sp.]
MNILFVCTHNRCRSILFEALTNFFGGGKLFARSGGSAPVDQVHPLTLKFLEEAGIPIDGLRPQSWKEMGDFQPDLMITLCDSAASETCPLVLATIPSVHWGLKDPSRIEGSAEEVALAFRDTITEIGNRIDTLLQMPLDDIDGSALALAISTRV